jgi:L-asparaginase II
MHVLAEVERSGMIESRHLGTVVVCDPVGQVVTALGDPELAVYPRSAVKPLQALAVRRLGVEERLGLHEAALASACGSHRAEPVHVDTVLATLKAAGLDDGALRCPPERGDDGGPPRAVMHNCSGKHAYMLAGTVAAGWPTAGYLEPEHPLQHEVARTLAAWTASPPGHVGVDGCGVPTWALPLRGLATAFARLASGEGDAPELLDAVGRHPVLIRGTGALDTVLVEATGGRLLAKIGAEAVYAVADRASGQGAALKVADGGMRAAGPALLAVLRALGWIDEAELAALLPAATTEVTGGGRPVGAVRPASLRLPTP